jgi:pyruvate formate lyase activating enzyme
LQSDPIEKKPFFHVMPGSNALTFGMLGCNLHCGFCQNWVTSQAGRDPVSDKSVESIRRTSPEQLVEIARRAGAGVVASSYNEPLITSEWAVDVFRQANQAGLKCVYISNGNLTPEVLEVLRPHIVGYKIDLKTMNDKHYRHLGGVLENVLEGIRLAHASGLWVEVVTLLIPGFNDTDDELNRLTAFVAGVSPDIPWHVTAFHKDYRMSDPENTTPEMLMHAAEIGRRNGLRYIYAGNLPGRVGDLENTRCPQCRALLVERYGYFIQSYRLTAEGACPDCGTKIPGRWGATFDGQIASTPFLPGSRRLRTF